MITVESIICKPYNRLFIWSVIAIIGLLGIPLSPTTLQCPTIDSAIFLTCAEWMKEGMVMYRDMFDHKGPLIYLFDMVGLSMGLTGVWLLCVIWHVLATYLVYLICRLYSSSKSSFIASSCYLLMAIVTGGDNTVELVAMPFVAFGMLVLMKPLHEQRQVSVAAVFIASICLATMFLLKPNIGAGIAFLAIVILLELVKNFSIKRFLFYFAAFLGAFTLVFLPLYLWLDAHEAWADYVSTFWVFNMEYSSGMSFTTKMINFLQLFFIYIPSLVSWGFVLYCMVRDWKTKDRNENLWLLAMLLFTGYVSTGVSGFRFGHYLLPVFPLFAIFIAKAFEGSSRYSGRIMMGIVLMWCGYFGYKQYKSYQFANNKEVKYNIEVAEYVKSNTSLNDRICLYGVDSSVYLLSGRKSVTKYIYQSPIFSIRPSMYNEFIDDILKNKPAMLLVGPRNSLPDDIINKYDCKCKIANGVTVFKVKQ